MNLYTKSHLGAVGISDQFTRCRPSVVAPKRMKLYHHSTNTPTCTPFASLQRENSPSRAPPPPPPPPTADDDDIEARIRHAANLIATCERLVPFDSRSTNMGLVIWKAIRDIPPTHRPSLVHRLSAGDMKRMFSMAGRRYGAPPSDVAAAIGPDYSLWKDMPQDIKTIVYFDGKAGLPTHAFGISSFTKAFFLSLSSSSSPHEDVIYGRVIHPNPLGNHIYPGPLYFKSSTIGSPPLLVPLTGELCDLTLSYLDPDQGLGLYEFDKQVPRSSTWPRPRKNKRPFDQGYVDYVRVAGPGLLVGMGYRTLSDTPLESGLYPLVPSPLYFVMAFKEKEVL